MVSSTSLSVGLLALTPLAAASSLETREEYQIISSGCGFMKDGAGDPPAVEYVEACINMLRNDFGDQICSLAIGDGSEAVWCDMVDVKVLGEVGSSGDIETLHPTCNAVADAAEYVKDHCDQHIGEATIVLHDGYVDVGVWKS